MTKKIVYNVIELFFSKVISREVLRPSLLLCRATEPRFSIKASSLLNVNLL